MNRIGPNTGRLTACPGGSDSAIPEENICVIDRSKVDVELFQLASKSARITEQRAEQHLELPLVNLALGAFTGRIARGWGPRNHVTLCLDNF